MRFGKRGAFADPGEIVAFGFFGDVAGKKLSKFVEVDEAAEITVFVGGLCNAFGKEFGDFLYVLRD
ncbi:MAG: hypothetical protein IK077_09215 [Thermoguttaceae bacterium]|nr:hypothetical protein [Thermoguttaceae bacterium]